MNNRLRFDQALKFVERGVLSANSNFIKVDIPTIKNKECFINNVKIENKNKPVVYFDIIFEDVIPNNREPFWIPHYLITSISNMSIDKMLEAYDMSENNRVEEIDIETDVINEVIDKSEATIDGIELREGQRFIFLQDVTPKYNNRIYTVRIENNKIKLIANRGRPKKILN